MSFAVRADHSPWDVVALAGRRIDEPGSPPGSFPASRIEPVRRALQRELRSHQVQELVCAAACGSDLIALDVAHTLGIAFQIILPTAVDKFRTLSVVDRGKDWGELFDKIVSVAQHAGRLTVLSSVENPDYFEANTSILRAAMKSPRCGAFVLWDGHSKGSQDATDDFKRKAIGYGVPVLEILTGAGA